MNLQVNENIRPVVSVPVSLGEPRTMKVAVQEQDAGRQPDAYGNSRLIRHSRRSAAETRNPVVCIQCVMDYSLRSPCGPPLGRSTRYALLSRLRGNDEKQDLSVS